MLVNGKWTTDWQPVQAKDDQGRFVRQVSSFRNWITADGSPGPTGTGGFKAEADIRLFVTLIRFDAAYHGLFKTNRKRIADYPRLSTWMARVLGLPGVRDTVNLDHIKAGYYSIKALNPTGIVPTGPDHVIPLLESVK